MPPQILFSLRFALCSSCTSQQLCTESTANKTPKNVKEPCCLYYDYDLVWTNLVLFSAFQDSLCLTFPHYNLKGKKNLNIICITVHQTAWKYFQFIPEVLPLKSGDLFFRLPKHVAPGLESHPVLKGWHIYCFLCSIFRFLNTEQL